jgi:two-component system response regulator HydG
VPIVRHYAKAALTVPIIGVMTLPRVLVVSDEQTGAVVRSALAQTFACEVANSGDAGLAAFGRGQFDVVVADSVDDTRGLDLLETIRSRSPGVPFILLGGSGDVESATEAGRRGVFEFVVKPLDGLALSRSVHRAVVVRKQHLDTRVGDSGAAGSVLIGSAPRFARTLAAIERAAQSSAPVLLVGETGTGKDLLAARLHALGPRRHRPFVVVNAAALPASLLDSELFGHVAGSFTGATRPRRGLIAEADGGTLFLDEIADLPLELQGRLLRVIETGRIRPVGSDHERTVDVRFVAATHQALSVAVAEKRFREDLFYRLNVLAVHVPPLRERGDDVAALVDHFFQRALTKAPRSPVREMSPEAYQRLLHARWPGNVRELAAVIERLVAFGEHARIEVRDLDGDGPQPAATAPPEEVLSLRELSLRHVETVLMMTAGDKTKAVALLGIDLSTLYRWKRRQTGV